MSIISSLKSRVACPGLLMTAMVFSACVAGGGGGDNSDDDGTLVAPGGGGSITNAEGATIEPGAEVANDVTGAYLTMPPGVQPYTGSFYISKTGGGTFTTGVSVELDVTGQAALALAAEQSVTIMFHRADNYGKYQYGIMAETAVAIIQKAGKSVMQFIITSPGVYQGAVVPKKVDAPAERETTHVPRTAAQVATAVDLEFSNVLRDLDGGWITFKAEYNADAEEVICAVIIRKDGVPYFNTAVIGTDGEASFPFAPQEPGDFTARFRCAGSNTDVSEETTETDDATVGAGDIVDDDTTDNFEDGASDRVNLIYHLFQEGNGFDFMTGSGSDFKWKSRLGPNNEYPDLNGLAHLATRASTCGGAGSGDFPRRENMGLHAGAKFYRNCIASDSIPFDFWKEDITIVVFVKFAMPADGVLLHTPFLCLGPYANHNGSPWTGPGCIHGLYLTREGRISAGTVYHNQGFDMISSANAVGANSAVRVVYRRSLDEGKIYLQVDADDPEDKSVGSEVAGDFGQNRIMLGGSPLLDMNSTNYINYIHEMELMEVRIFDGFLDDTQVGEVIDELNTHW